MKTTILALLFAAFSGAVFGQAKPDSKAGVPVDDPLPEPADVPHEWRTASHQVGTLVEFIELDARLANKLVRKYAASLSAALLREELEAMIEEGAADLTESCYAKTQAGRRVKVVSVNERIDPTEYDPPEIPQTATLTNAIAPGTAANATAFDTRDVGPILEVEPDISEDYRWVDVNIATSVVTYLGRDYTIEEREEWAINDPRRLSSTIYMPKFYTMRDSTSVTVFDGDTVLLSLNRPHGDEDKMIMVLMRVDIVK